MKKYIYAALFFIAATLGSIVAQPAMGWVHGVLAQGLIAYIANGGITASNDINRWGHRLSVIDDFGADPTGIADSTIALGSALAYSNTQPIYFPCGIYKVSSPLTVPASGILLGQMNYPWQYLGFPATSVPCVRITPSGSWIGAPTLTTSANTVSGVVLPFTNTMGVAVGQSISGTNIPAGSYVVSLVANTSVTISNNITGTVASGVSVVFTAGVLNLGGYTHIESIGIDGASGSVNSVALFYTNQPFDELVHVWTNGGGYGINVAYNGNPLQQGVRIRDSIISYSHGDCVLLNSTADFDITRNDFNSCVGYALNINAAANGIIALNLFQNSTAGGARFAGGSYGNAVTGNRFIGNYGSGLYFSGLTGSNSFSGNTFQVNGSNAGNVTGAHIVWNATDHTGGCQTFSGSSYYNNAVPPYLAIVQAGAAVTCGKFYENLPAQITAVFGSTTSAAINSMSWAANVITANTTSPHGLIPSTGRGVTIIISGATPTGYNGTYWCTTSGASQFTCPQTISPGANTVPGTYVARYAQAVLQPFINYVPSDLPGPYANDNDASLAGIPIGAEYSDTSGVRRKRIS